VPKRRQRHSQNDIAFRRFVKLFAQEGKGIVFSFAVKLFYGVVEKHPMGIFFRFGVCRTMFETYRLQFLQAVFDNAFRNGAVGMRLQKPIAAVLNRIGCGNGRKK
jgi:hypothetical protein